MDREGGCQYHTRQEDVKDVTAPGAWGVDIDFSAAIIIGITRQRDAIEATEQAANFRVFHTALEQGTHIFAQGVGVELHIERRVDAVKGILQRVGQH